MSLIRMFCLGILTASIAVNLALIGAYASGYESKTKGLSGVVASIITTVINGLIFATIYLGL